MKKKLREQPLTESLNHTLLLLKKEMLEERHSILHWWIVKMTDWVNGGFYGKIDAHQQLHPLADKGVILNTRILWTFSAAANSCKNEQYQEIADRAFNYLKQYFLDEKNGGLFWMLDYKGIPTQTRKQIYAQAFGIYGLTEYYHLTKNETAIQLALDLFEQIEKHSLDKLDGGYFEAFTETWQPIEDLRLSEKDANEAKTMNTHLHILEAYTNLYRVYPNKQIAVALRRLIECFLEKFVNADNHHLFLFFDEKWVSKSEAISFGHDIEASWLLYEAAEILGDEAILNIVEKRSLEMAGVTLNEGFDHTGGIMYEQIKDHFDKEKHWWVQAEAVIGFYNAFEISKEEKFLKAATNTWEFIKNHILDKEHGEWIWSILENGTINTDEDKAGAWKAPYHNGRMCMEILKRVSGVLPLKNRLYK